MNRLYGFVVRHRGWMIALFLCAFAICLACKPLVAVNYDMNDYLPADSASTLALDKLREEYEGGIPNARVMAAVDSVAGALEIKAALEQVDGVDSVLWLDDAADVNVPLETLDADVVAEYYAGGNALFTLTIDEDRRIEAVNAVRALIGEDNAMTGSAVSTAAATQSTVREISSIALIAVIFVFLVLVLTTASFAEPLLVLGGLGVAVIINAGSNLMFGEISFVTNAAGNILQLAVSLDYSVFLLHRFEECRREAPDTQTAMVRALSGSTGSILSSGLTTVIGFLALCLMRFGIGPDLGLALAKGVAISLLTVFLFMPALILTACPLIDRWAHRPLLPSFRKFGGFVRRAMLPMTAVFALLIVPCYLASNANSFYYGASHIFGENTQTGSDTQRIEACFGQQDNYVLLLPKGDTAQQQALSAALHEIPEIKSIVSYVDTVGAVIPEEYLPGDTLSKLNSADYTRMVLTVDAPYEGDAAFDLIGRIRGAAEACCPGQWLLAGEGVSTCDLRDTVTADMTKVNLLAIGAVFLVLLLSLRSPVAPVILVLSIETAIWINLSIPYFSGSVIFYIAYLIISSIQLGATVDYAILFTDRYRELRMLYPKKQAVSETVAATAASILTSASVLTAVGFLLGAISTHGLLSQLGYFLGKGTLCSLTVVLFVLPGLLYLFDGAIVRKKSAKEGINK